MSQLVNQSKGTVLLTNIRTARSFRDRALGLIGTKDLNNQQGVYFKKCNWIHTFFMSITIDVIYLNKKNQVVKLQPQLKPWKIPAPVWTANSVIEIQPGRLATLDISIGDTLNVGD